MAGIKSLKGTRAWNLVEKEAPDVGELTKHAYMIPYKLNTVSTSMAMLGTMCDYGVRSRFPNSYYHYITKSKTDAYNYLLWNGPITAVEAYYLSNIYLERYYWHDELSDDIIRDYTHIVERAYAMYATYGPGIAKYGAYFEYGDLAFECDILNNFMVGDLKVTSKGYNNEHMYQIMSYSFLCNIIDGRLRNSLHLYYPVQGEVYFYTFNIEKYTSLVAEFEHYLKEGY